MVQAVVVRGEPRLVLRVLVLDQLPQRRAVQLVRRLAELLDQAKLEPLVGRGRLRRPVYSAGTPKAIGAIVGRKRKYIYKEKNANK